MSLRLANSCPMLLIVIGDTMVVARRNTARKFPLHGFLYYSNCSDRNSARSVCDVCPNALPNFQPASLIAHAQLVPYAVSSMYCSVPSNTVSTIYSTVVSGRVDSVSGFLFLPIFHGELTSIRCCIPLVVWSQ
jgi:hypothetical protein